MSNRLTNEVKQNITHALIEHKFAPIRKEIGEESSVIADLAYSLIVSDATAKLLTKLAPGWVPKYAGLYLSYEGKTNFYKFSVDPTTAREERRRFIPHDIEANQSSRCCSHFQDHLRFSASSITTRATDPVYVKRKTIAKKMKSMLAKSTKMADDTTNAKSYIKAVLDSVTTRAKLIEVWPEIESVVDSVWPVVTDEPGNALAVRIDDLNASLDLPPKKK